MTRSGLGNLPGAGPVVEKAKGKSKKAKSEKGTKAKKLLAEDSWPPVFFLFPFSFCLPLTRMSQPVPSHRQPCGDIQMRLSNILPKIIIAIVIIIILSLVMKP